MRDFLPLQAVLCLWELTQGRLQVRIEQPGHLYFHGFNLHSSHSTDEIGLGFDSCSFSITQLTVALQFFF